jgi:hypothetical protein
MDSIKLEIYDQPSDAPNYNTGVYEAVKLKSAVIVHNGTVNGNSTVDLIFVDAQGNKHVALVKASYLEMITRIAVTGK